LSGSTLMNEERINEEQSDSTMSDQSKENANTQRRTLLFGAGATGAMAVWHKPVVDGCAWQCGDWPGVRQQYATRMLDYV